jgi:murein DD-endopeptidase MepM/ murein hydrolase activator NlpD
MTRVAGHRRRRNALAIPLTFLAGVATGMILLRLWHVDGAARGDLSGPRGPEPAAAASADRPIPPVTGDAARLDGGTAGARMAAEPPPPPVNPGLADLIARHLDLPVEGVGPEDLLDTFDAARDRSRRHEALDILAPRGTHVRAVEAGTIEKLFTSVAGGLTIYQFDPTRTYAYYYAHLDGYARGLAEHDAVQRGQVIGFVGTTGNAPEDTPHLHFAIFQLTAAKQWWTGTPLNPYDVWRPQAR